MISPAMLESYLKIRSSKLVRKMTHGDWQCCLISRQENVRNISLLKLDSSCSTASCTIQGLKANVWLNSSCYHLQPLPVTISNPLSIPHHQANKERQFLANSPLREKHSQNIIAHKHVNIISQMPTSLTFTKGSRRFH